MINNNKKNNKKKNKKKNNKKKKNIMMKMKMMKNMMTIIDFFLKLKKNSYIRVFKYICNNRTSKKIKKNLNSKQ